jgi:hypothetical protein
VALSRLPKFVLPLVFGALPAFGQLYQISQPTSGYTSATTLVPITAPDGTVLTSLTDGTQTVTLGFIAPGSSVFEAHTVGGGGWSTWGAPPATESSTPRVVGSYTSVTSLTLALSVPSRTFGFEIEPDTLSNFTISAAYYSGGTLLGTISQSINGHGGALLAAGSSNLPITAVVITAPSGANGFAMAQFRYGSTTLATPVPALSTTVMMSLGGLLAAAGAFLARAQQRSGAVRP